MWHHCKNEVGHGKKKHKQTGCKQTSVLPNLFKTNGKIVNQTVCSDSFVVQLKPTVVVGTQFSFEMTLQVLTTSDFTSK